MSRDGARTVTAVVLAVALGGGALAYGGFQLHKLRQIENGPAVEGRATDWAAHPSRGRTVYRLKYTFARAGSDHAGGPVRVSKELHDATRAGAPLVVRSAPVRPDWHLPEEALADAKSDAVLTVFTGALVLVFVLTALVLVWAANRRRARAAPADNFPKDPPTGSP